MLEKEIQTYRNNKSLLQSKYPDGGFVVIKEDKILGVWQTRVDALHEGFKEYGNVSFLVKNIFESDIVANFSRNINLAF